MSRSATEWPAAAAQPGLPLEERVQKLEECFAAFSDPQALEERVAERVVHQLQAAKTAEAERIAAAPQRTPPPAAVPAAEAEEEVAARILALVAPVAPQLKGLPWLLVDICREIVAMFRMFVDFNYKVAWSTRVLTLILLPAILTSWWWMPLTHLPLVGGTLEKVFDLVLSFIMFKALHREARRYMETRTKK